MYKSLNLKTSREFLKNDFPENILPNKKLSKKNKRLIQEKIVLLKKVKRRIENLEKTLQIKKRQDLLNKGYLNKPLQSKTKQHTSLGHEVSIFNKALVNRNFGFLFSSDQIRYDLLRKQNQNKTFSDFLLKLKEKKKFSILYGNISRNFFEKAYNQAQKYQGRFNENLLFLFERRLDIVLYRICFFKTIAAARQSINHNCILVNGIIINIPSYQVKPGDIISLGLKKRSQIAKNSLEFLNKKLTRRYFRFLISNQFLERKFATRSIPLKSVETRNVQSYYVLPRSGKKTVKKEGFVMSNKVRHRQYSPKFWKEKSIEKLLYILKKLLHNLTKQRYVPKKNMKRFWILEGILRMYYYMGSRNNEVEPTTYVISKNQSTYYVSSKCNIKKLKLSLNNLTYIKVKKLMYRNTSRQARLSAMSINPLKPLNIEVSYRLLRAVVLYSPQKLVFPATLNIDLLSRSIRHN